jgi:hypothetical protein
MRLVGHPEVPQELEAAALWYEQRQPGLGGDFLEEYQATLARILNEPDRWHKIRGENRKLNFTLASGQKCRLTHRVGLWQLPAVPGELNGQVSLTRAAPSTRGAQKQAAISGSLLLLPP